MKKLAILCYFIYASAAFSQIPQTISYQGLLTDRDGNPVADGNRQLTFRLYAAATGGTALWEETQQIPVINGIFNAILGSLNPLNLPFDRPYWLGVQIEGGAELEPRIALTASAYSLTARAVADSAVTGENIAGGQVVRSLNGLTDEVTLAAGENINLSVDGQTVTLSASGQVAESRNTLDAADGDPVDAVFVDNDGKVGIGTTTPAQQLDITGNLQLPATSVSAGDTIGLMMVNGNRFIHSFGTDNFFAGRNAGNLSMTGTGNTANGVEALRQNTIGIGNTATGAFALLNNTTGSANTATGASALVNNTTGFSNTATGAFTLVNNTTGFSNTANGDSVLFNNSTGFSNTATGTGALFNNTTGDGNTANGYQALRDNTTGSGNAATGDIALVNNTSGSENTAFGKDALSTNIAGNRNTAIGFGADVSAENLTNATAIGANAVVDASNKMRLGDANVTLVETAATVSAAAFVGDGSQLTGLSGASPWTTTGNDIYYNDGKVGIGETTPLAPLHLQTSDLGVSADMLGSNTALLIESSDSQIRLVSDGAGTSGSAIILAEVRGGVQDDQWNIRRRTVSSGSDLEFIHTNGNVMVLEPGGNVGIGTTSPKDKLHVNGNALAIAHTTPSSRRWKTNIETIENPLHTVQQLRGVTYDWKASGKHDIGLIAEEVGAVIPEVVTYEENGIDAKSVDYARLVVVLIEAVKELSARVEQLEREKHKKWPPGASR
ncbi:MAG: tail fiber domain-containing protein [candidate division KSB1 bacterium]|nr:tail fiber domain-containing protein [candidate division KSB1 bacterium]